jgi:hypothetical protein
MQGLYHFWQSLPKNKVARACDRHIKQIRLITQGKGKIRLPKAVSDRSIQATERHIFLAVPNKNGVITAGYNS